MQKKKKNQLQDIKTEIQKLQSQRLRSKGMKEVSPLSTILPSQSPSAPFPNAHNIFLSQGQAL